MITVEEALERLFALAGPLEVEEVPLRRALGRVLADRVVADRDQPPFAASAMDGYAVCEADHRPGAVLAVIGESAAGARFTGRLAAGQAVRIFTGAPVPDGADRVVLQEDARREGGRITLGAALEAGTHIRSAGQDFRRGQAVTAPRRLGPRDLALIAAMNAAEVTVARRPVVALLATGNELVMPGSAPGPDQIIASNSFGLGALAEREGAEVRMLPVVPDLHESLAHAFALAEGADVIVTIGGASVGDHDLVAPVTEALGMERSFYRIAMRPGKPLMAGRLGRQIVLGLPGNPVSSIVCAYLFLLPLLRALQGLPAERAPRRTARLAEPLAANGPREHYMRARTRIDGAVKVISAFPQQDSALLSVLAEADALLVRPPNDPARTAGEMVEYICL